MFEVLEYAELATYFGAGSLEVSLVFIGTLISCHLSISDFTQRFCHTIFSSQTYLERLCNIKVGKNAKQTYDKMTTDNKYILIETVH